MSKQKGQKKGRAPRQARPWGHNLEEYVASEMGVNDKAGDVNMWVISEDEVEIKL